MTSSLVSVVLWRCLGPYVTAKSMFQWEDETCCFLFYHLAAVTAKPLGNGTSKTSFPADSAEASGLQGATSSLVCYTYKGLAGL